MAEVETNILDYTQPVLQEPPQQEMPPQEPRQIPTLIVVKRKPSLQQRQKVYLAIALAVAVVLIMVIIHKLFSPSELGRSLARCGWVFYAMPGCGYCSQQKAILGGRYPKTVVCRRSSGGACASISGFPFWHNARTGESRSGLQDAEELVEMAQW